MTTYRVRAEPDDGWWALTIEGDDLPRAFHTQAKRLDQAAHMARDLVALVLDVDYADIGAVQVVPVLDDRLSTELEETRRMRERAEKERAEAAERSRELARRLRAQGMTMRDIGTLLSITHQGARKLLTG